MAIKKLTIQNFKSFRHQEIELGKFNVLIGANASGKSNFIQVFRFLRDIVYFGLDDAISLQGGMEYLRNISIGASEDLLVKLSSDSRALPTFSGAGLQVLAKIEESNYEFALHFDESGREFRIAKDNLIQKGIFVRLEESLAGVEEKEHLGEGEIVVSNVGGKVKIELNVPKLIAPGKEGSLPLLWQQSQFTKKNFLLAEHLSFHPQEIAGVPIYDFEPRLAKKAVPITGRAELEGDGSNLALVLKNLLNDTERRRKFSNLIKDCLSFVDSVDIEEFTDKSLLFKLREIYFPRQYLLAAFISDGTIDIAALIVALLFEKKILAIFEEPERNLHPHLISKVVDMMKEASENKQIIVSTHNPEVVRHAGLENLLLVSRDKDGFSTISRPGDKEEVKAFLQDEIGIEDLYVQDLLGI